MPPTTTSASCSPATTSTPSRWPSPTTGTPFRPSAAARAGKDIYGEKPLSHDLREGRAMCDAVKQYGRIWQTGCWQRSQAHFRFACELVRNGRIGKVHTRRSRPARRATRISPRRGQEPIVPPPPELDYDMWIGPAPCDAVLPGRVHKNWRWNLTTAAASSWTGSATTCDIAHWGMGCDNTGPVEIEGDGEFPKTGSTTAPPGTA